MEDYIPYGEDWEKELLKMSKSDMAKMAGQIARKLQQRCEKLEGLAKYAFFEGGQIYISWDVCTAWETSQAKTLLEQKEEE